jgi:hypothetical protein
MEEPQQPGSLADAPAPANRAPNWHPDPLGSDRLRWWDGERWTDQTQERQIVAVAAAQSAAQEAAAQLEPKPIEQRKAALADRVQYFVGSGYRVESQTDFQAILVRGRRPNHLLHLILSVITVGLWALFVWLPLAIFGGEKRKVITVDEYGRALET